MGERTDLYRLSSDLDAIAINAKNCYWISTPNGDQGSEWCRDCGHAKVRNLRRHDRKNRCDYILDGGWRSEHDSMPICAGCGVILDGSLTEHGASYELDYYAEVGLSTSRETDALYLSEIAASIDREDAEGIQVLKRLASELFAAPHSEAKT